MSPTTETADDGGDLIISGGQMHPVDEVPTTNVSARDMDAFLKSHAERMRKEKERVAARAGKYYEDQEPVEKGAQDHESGDAPPTADAPTVDPSAATTVLEGPDSAPGAEVPGGDRESAVSGSPTPGDADDETKETAVATSPPASSDSNDASDGPVTDPALTPTEPAMQRPGSARRPASDGRPASGRRPATGDARPSSRRQAARQPKKMSSVEKGLYIFIAVCVVAGAINFYLKRPQPEPPQTVEAPPPLAQQDKLWLAAVELAGEAETLTKQATVLNQSGDKEQATQIYKQAEDIWQKVYANIDKIAELGVDFDDPGYGRWQKKITRWTKSFQECVKFQQVDDFDYEDELRKARERNRLDEQDDD